MGGSKFSSRTKLQGGEDRTLGAAAFDALVVGTPGGGLVFGGAQGVPMMLL